MSKSASKTPLEKLLEAMERHGCNPQWDPVKREWTAQCPLGQNSLSVLHIVDLSDGHWLLCCSKHCPKRCPGDKPRADASLGH
jgi:hypothetical protein